MTTPASYPTGANQAFGAGINHLVNPGRANGGSITLDGSLQADSARWDGMTPHGVLRTAQTTGTPADTGTSAELGQEAAGNADDAALVQTSMRRMMRQQAAATGSNDNIA